MRRFLRFAVATSRAIPDVPFVEGKGEALVGFTQTANVIAYRRNFLDLALHIEVECQIAAGIAVGLAGVAVIAMERDKVDIVIALLEHLAIPFEEGPHTGAARTTCDELQRVIDRAHLAGGIGCFQTVLGGRHMADLPGAIHFIAETPRFDIVGRGEAVTAAQLAPAGSADHVAILDESRGLLCCSASQVDGKQRLGSCGTAPADELIGAELVGFERVPCAIEDSGPFLFRSNSIAPVISGDEVAARIAHDGNADRADFFDDILAQTVGAGMGRTGIVDTAVDGAAEVLQEGPQDTALEIGVHASGVETDSRGPAARLREAPLPGASGQRGAAGDQTEEFTTIGCMHRWSLADDFVRPFDQGDEDRGIAEHGIIVRQVGFRDAAGARTRATGVYRYRLGLDFFQSLRKGRPAHRDDGSSDGFAHERDGLAEQEDLYFVSGFGEGKPMKKRERCLGGIVRSPGALHHDLERLALWRRAHGGGSKEGQGGQLRDESASCHRRTSSLGWEFSDHFVKIAQAGGHTFGGRNPGGAEFDILLDDQPAGVAIFYESAKEGREVDTALADLGEDAGFDGLVEVELPPVGSGKSGGIDVFDVDVAQQVFVLLSLGDGVTSAVVAVAGVETEAHFGSGDSIVELFGFARRFNVSSDVRMKDKVESETGGDPLGLGDHAG